MNKSIRALWTELFYGGKQRHSNGSRYPRKGGLVDISKKNLNGYDGWEIKLCRELLFSAAKERDIGFLCKAKSLCEIVGIEYHVFMTSATKIWAKEDEHKWA